MSSGADRVRRHREKMKAAGLKPVTIWVTDMNMPANQDKIARAVAAINADDDSKRVLEDMLELADFSD